MNDGKTKSRPAKRDNGAISHRPTRVVARFRLLMRAALPLAAATLMTAPPARAQQLPIAGNATGFYSVEYYGAPHQQEIKCLFSGTEAAPIAGGLLLIKQVKLEKFDLSGKLQLIAEAPECVYDPVNAAANSPGAVHLRTGDGSLTIDGEGFLWRQNQSVFTISNQVKTVFDKLPALKK